MDNLRLTTHEGLINALIPRAEQEATTKAANMPEQYETRTGAEGKPMNWHFWTEYYHQAMNRMAKQRRLRW